MTSIIVDTSVVVKWFSEENEDDYLKARQIKARIVEGTLSLICPEIIALELINVLTYSKKFTQDECTHCVKSFIELCSDVVPLPDLDRTIDSVHRYTLASYDAAFVTLAMMRNVHLITADYKHHKKSISPHIVWLSEWK